MDIPDPDQWTTFALTPEGGAHSAFTNYENPEVIALNKKAQLSNDPAERAVLYSQIQQMAGDDAFLTYLYYSPYAYASTDLVKGFAVTPLGNYHTEDIYKIK